MDFARKQLEKYGWSDGKGLGKHENGISEALKPKIKRSVAGVGHDPAAEFNEHWWTALYDKAAGNVEVEEKNGKTKKIKTKDDNVIITTSTWKMNKKKKEDGTEQYSEHFVRTAVLTNGGSKVENVKSTDSDSEGNDDTKKDVFKMTDEELFAACEGRTAHKGARHGLKATGKLARIAQQEALLLKESRFKGYSHVKKLQENVVEDMNLDSENEINNHKIKKKKRKRCYSSDKNLGIGSNVAESERPLPVIVEECQMSVDDSVASETKTEKKSRKSKIKREFNEAVVESCVPKKKNKQTELSEMENNSNCVFIDPEVSLKKKKKKNKDS